ncbi:putative aminopeptidase YsdC [Polycladomyces abyssicola]|uniref:Putative aminopeptidase YsdC n=2 Tax=Polycladomyces abyssicola TaxID=1125966 RepID=A0A8D5ZK43_9BACL|nr:putative aminopeptidase YsdC [Polycladomyces abyssicola]
MVMDELRSMLAELTNAGGPPGHEGNVREVMRRWTTPVADEVTSDRLGGLIAWKKGTADEPRVMVAGHLDEIGFMVTRVTKDGYLRFQPLGGWWSQVLPAQRVEVHTKQGIVIGVIGSKPPHLMSPEQRNKPVKTEDLFIDVGASSQEEAESFGIRPGDPVIPHSPFTVLKNEKLWMAKAMDNRVGCAVAAEVLRRLQHTDHPNTVAAVGTVMEEVGRRGAFTASAAVKPDVAFAVDVGIAGDTPGVGKDEAASRLGEGPTVVLADGGHLAHRGLLALVQKTAEEQGIPLQPDTLPRGATDASHIHLHGRGVPTLTLGIPARYIHSHASIIHRDDLENLIRLLVEVIRKLDRTTVYHLCHG